MDIKSLEELRQADERTLRFAPLGLALGGMLRPEDAAVFQQETISHAELVPAVTESTRNTFERLRLLFSYGCCATTSSPRWRIWHIWPSSTLSGRDSGLSMTVSSRWRTRKASCIRWRPRTSMICSSRSTSSVGSAGETAVSCGCAGLVS